MTRMFWDTAAILDPHASELRGRALSAPLTRAGGLANLLRGVGAIGVEEGDLTIWMRFFDFGNFWSTFSNGQGNQGGYVARLEQPQREKLQSALFDAYCAGRPDGRRSFAATATGLSDPTNPAGSGIECVLMAGRHPPPKAAGNFLQKVASFRT